MGGQRDALAEIGHAQKRLSVLVVVVLLLDAFLLNSWLEHKQFDDLVGEQNVSTSVLFLWLVSSAIPVLLVLVSVIFGGKKPRAAFGLSAAVGFLSLLWGFRGFVLLARAVVLTSRASSIGAVDSAAAALGGHWTVVLPAAMVNFLVGIFVLMFSIPAFKASGLLEDSPASVRVVGTYGSMIAETPSAKKVGREVIVHDPETPGRSSTLRRPKRINGESE